MHFWINKPGGRYYGFTGRRYPAVPLLKTRFNRYRYNAELRQMVTPLHRFQNLHAAGNVAGPSAVNNCRVIRTMIRANNESNVTTAGNNQLILSNATANGTNRSMLDFSEFNEIELVNYRVRYAVCMTFILVTGYIVVAKFYFGNQNQGIELILFSGVLTFLLFACFYTILHHRSQRNNHQEHHIQEEHIASVTATNAIPNENIRPISVVRQNPPPPYHIAILIPPPNSSDEAPPPSYDKVVR